MHLKSYPRAKISRSKPRVNASKIAHVNASKIERVNASKIATRRLIVSLFLCPYE